MATTISTNWSSGTFGNKTIASCVGVAGQNLPSAYYRAQGGIEIRRNGDGSIDVRQMSLAVEQNAISNVLEGGWGGDDWTFHGLYISRSSFTLTDSPSGPSGYGVGVKVWSDGKVSHEGYGTGDASSHYSWLSSGSSSGWNRLANSMDELEFDSSRNELYIYAGGLIDFSSTPTSSISIPAQRIALTTDSLGGWDALFEYYPWQRRINGIWYSLNREGGLSSNAGLFRYLGGYRPCTNHDGESASEQHGFTYNNGWQISPRSGEGA